MPANEFNVGRDATLDILDPEQGPLRFKLRTNYEVTPQNSQLESNALDGVPRFASIPRGWRVAFGLDRAGPEVDDYFARKEENYFAGRVNPLLTLTETIQEITGQISQYRYSGVSLTLEGGGTWKGDAITTQSLVAMCSRRRKIS